MRRLAFYNRFLAAVRAGRKTATIRKTRVVRHLRSGEVLLLAFGSWRKPTLLRAWCTEVVRLEPGRLSAAERRRIARADGITAHDLDYLLADPEPKTLVRFELAGKRPLLELSDDDGGSSEGGTRPASNRGRG